MRPHPRIIAEASEQIVQAYENARYIVQAPGGEILLRIGQRNPAFDSLMRSHHTDSAAILTAWNPGGEPCDASRNTAAQTALEAELQAVGATVLAGRNMPAEDAFDMSGWTEPTVTVFGIARAQAKSMALAYGQLAFVYVRAGGAPELIWTRPPQPKSG